MSDSNEERVPFLIFPGSFAAVTQAGIGNVVAGSLFAGAQSVAMGGALPAIGTAIAGGISAGAAALGVRRL